MAATSSAGSAARTPTVAFATFESFQEIAPALQSGMVQFVMANGVIAQLWMSYEVPVESVGELGRYLITGSTGVIDFNAYGDVRVDRGDGQGWVTEWKTPPFQYLADPFTVNRVKGFADQFQDFLDAITEGRQPAVTGADGRAAIAMVEAAERSSQLGRGGADLRAMSNQRGADAERVGVGSCREPQLLTGPQCQSIATISTGVAMPLR